MAITTVDGFTGAARQYPAYVKTATRTVIAGNWFTLFDLAGQPGAGVLAGTSVAAGVVPVAGGAGFPSINSIAASGYLSGVQFGSSVACRLSLFDLLWKAGAYAFNAAQALTGQPSFAARVPEANYAVTSIWIETVTAFTGIPTFTITYTNQSGVAGRTATIAAASALTLGRMLQVPLRSGDTGVQLITNVTCTVATVGTFNVLVMRALWSGRVRIANDGGNDNMVATGLPPIFSTTALYLAVAADATSSGNPELRLTVSDG